MGLKLGKVLRTSKKDGKTYTNYELKDSNGYTIQIKFVYFDNESDKAKRYRRAFIDSNVTYIRDDEHQDVEFGVKDVD